MITSVSNSAPVVLFAGDSITAAGRGSGADDLGHGYVALLAAQRLGDHRVINAGIGGHRVRDLEVRWESDVLAVPADVISIYIGINDTWRRFDRGETTTADEFAAGYRRLLEPLADRGAQVILVEPFLVPVEPEQQDWLPDLTEKQRVVSELAAEFATIHVPLDRPLNDLAATIGPRAVAGDGVHPTEAGHQAIADAWWQASGFPAATS